MRVTNATRPTFETLTLAHGSHDSPTDGLCVMEAVAYFRGIEHTDHPACVSPAIGAFLRTWNDNLADEPRQLLKPYVFKVVGTATTPADEERRAWLATDWLVRIFTPAWLELAGLKDHAEKLRQLPELTSTQLANAAIGEIDAALSAAAAARDAAWDAARDAARAAARDAARAAAWDAARAAAWAAAWDAARDAAGAAAWDAAWAAAGAAAWDAAWAAARAAAWAAAWAAARDAARDAAWDAAWDAARAAAWDAARAAVGKALAPTVQALQSSAFVLLDRMIAVKETDEVAA